MVYLSEAPLMGADTLIPFDLRLRSINAGDQSFLKQVYASTRAEELAYVPWSETEKTAFLDFQFNAQHVFYQKQFANAAFWLIEQSGVPIGRLYLDRRADEIRIIDIALLPDYRDRGIGTALLQLIVAEGQTNHLPVRIHVECGNRAIGLYQRLGFVQIGGGDVYKLMEWTP